MCKRLEVDGQKDILKPINFEKSSKYFIIKLARGNRVNSIVYHFGDWETVLHYFELRQKQLVVQNHQRCSIKKVFLEISKNSQENACARVSILIKLQALASACNFIKIETLAQVFSCEFCKISKNTFFTEHVWATASINFWSYLCKIVIQSTYNTIF